MGRKRGTTAYMICVTVRIKKVRDRFVAPFCNLANNRGTCVYAAGVKACNAIAVIPGNTMAKGFNHCEAITHFAQLLVHAVDQYIDFLFVDYLRRDREQIIHVFPQF